MIRFVLILAVALTVYSRSFSQEPEILEESLLPVEEAQGSEDPELAQMEEKYLEDLTAARKELGGKYLAALERLQDSLTRERKFDQALLVKQEIERVNELLASRVERAVIPDTEASYDPVVLRPESATLKGKIDVSKANILYRWSRGASAEWLLPADLPEGVYEIILDRSCNEGEGGTYTVSTGKKELKGSVIGSGVWTDWSQVHVGNIEIDVSKSNVLKFSADKITRNYLMNVNRVVVAQAGTWQRIQSGESLEALNSVEGDGGSGKPPKMLREFNGATLVQGDETPVDGDSFYVKYKDENYHLRLYWVDAPMDVVDADSEVQKAAVSEEATYFGIKSESSIRVGKAAASYVQKLLSAAPFTVLVSRQTSYSGGGQARKMAMVKVNGKFLSQLLVENGLVRIQGTPTEIPGGPGIDEYTEILKNAEAKAREERKGAWGLE